MGISETGVKAYMMINGSTKSEIFNYFMKNLVDKFIS
jgi:hypothetical protein